MSRAYRIRVSESESSVIQSADAIETQLHVLQILPPQEMTQLIAEELRRRGFQDAGDQLRGERAGVIVSIDPTTGTVALHAESTDEVEIEATRKGIVYDDTGPSKKDVREQLSRQAKEELASRMEDKRRTLQQKTTEKLEGALHELCGELDQVVNRVTAEALKRKAAQMGQIKEIHEDAEAGSLTIKIEV